MLSRYFLIRTEIVLSSLEWIPRGPDSGYSSIGMEISIITRGEMLLREFSLTFTAFLLNRLRAYCTLSSFSSSLNSHLRTVREKSSFIKGIFYLPASLFRTKKLPYFHSAFRRSVAVISFYWLVPSALVTQYPASIFVTAVATASAGEQLRKIKALFVVNHIFFSVRNAPSVGGSQWRPGQFLSPRQGSSRARYE